MDMRILAVTAFGLVGAYGAWPFVSLYEIRQDVQSHNVRALTADIDWPLLREGLKEDIADGITGETGQTVQVNASASDDLPPFGSGFVNNMAGNMVDQTVTPQHLAMTVGTLQAAGAHRMTVSQAYFAGPTRFMVALSAAPAAASKPALRLQMDLVRTGMSMRWKITRAWLPPDMLEAAESHAS
jgi:hypothetical protein